MEGIRGNRALTIDAAALAGRLGAYQDILVDIGTGDGRYPRHVAQASPACFAIGVDACRENLRAASRAAPENVLYLIASAQALPPELYGLATRITINFPWGSLMSGLIDSDPALLAGLGRLARPGAALDLRLNGAALAAAGCSLEAGGERARRALRDSGFVVRPPRLLGAQELRACPTTWAKRLAFGRDPRALHLRAFRPDARQARSVQPLAAACRC